MTPPKVAPHGAPDDHRFSARNDRFCALPLGDQQIGSLPATPPRTRVASDRKTTVHPHLAMRGDRTHRRYGVRVATKLQSDLSPRCCKKFTRRSANFPAWIVVHTVYYAESDMIWRIKMGQRSNPQMLKVPTRGLRSDLNPTKCSRIRSLSPHQKSSTRAFNWRSHRKKHAEKCRRLSEFLRHFAEKLRLFTEFLRHLAEELRRDALQVLVL